MADPRFDKTYYDKIWGDVHRHDYCESLADQLINKYNPKSVLDLGGGCGELVRVLRGRGVEAYNLEVSDYAVANSHGFTLKGDVRDIPFKDGMFDLVHSQGLWEYIPEADIPKAWSECLRVGRQQEHNIDTLNDQSEWSKDFITHKSEAWWAEKLRQPKVLVACPVAQTSEINGDKESAFAKWVENVQNLTYPNYDILVVDNSPKPDFYERWKDKVPMKRIDVTGLEMFARINKSMEAIRKHFLEGDYTHWMNIESDNIPQSDVIEKLMAYNGDWISHAYPQRDNASGTLDEQGIGCSLLSRRLIENFDWSGAGDNSYPDSWLWDRVKPRAYEFPVTELWGYLKVEHLAS